MTPTADYILTPYSDFLYFGLALYVLVPTLLVRLVFRFSQTWILIASVFMLALCYQSRLVVANAWAVNELGVVGAYAAYELLVAAMFLWLRRRTASRWAFWSALALGLAPLLVAKLLPRFSPDSQLGFLGISYVTFRSLDVIFGIQDRLITGLAPGQYLAYLFFFPTVSSGPIDRYRRFADDWKRYHTRAEFLVDLDGAVHRIFTGFLYKFILAALIERYWLEPLNDFEGPLALISYMYAYSLYLFFDFAGYSAFAIGFSYLFGIHTPENFNRPFLATNIRDFWNRWHITLSFWLRDHVYMRFVMAATKGRWFKGRYTASHIGFFLSFGLMGLWHGIEPNYIIYGLYHACLLTGYDVFSRWNRRRKLWGDGPLWRVVAILVTVHLVCFGFLIFSGELGRHRLWPSEETPSASLPSNRVVDGAKEDGVHQEVEGKAAGDAAVGWAWDPSRPDEPISVDIYDGDQLIDTVRADRHNERLAKAGMGNGNHVFIYHYPPILHDGKEHTIRVRIAGSDIDLKETPRKVVIPAALENPGKNAASEK
jgi:membrane protein involved in D-alanine export